MDPIFMLELSLVDQFTIKRCFNQNDRSLVLTKYVISVIIFLTLEGSTFAEYNVAAYCSLVPENTKLASIDDSQTYYVCQKGQPLQQKCADNQWFDKNAQNCLQLTQVEPCAGVTKGYVSIPNDCYGFIYCLNGVEKGRGNCESGLIFRDGECRYGSCNNGQGTGNGAELKSACEIMPNNKFFGDTFNCKNWHKCVNGEEKQGECPNSLVFDVQGQQCNYKSDNICSRVTGPSIPCNDDSKNAIEPDSKDCSKYYQCLSKWDSKVCEAGKYFDTNSKRCEERQSATPSATCDRCKGSKDKQFVNAVDPECRKYTICQNGEFSSGNSGACGDTQFFDEYSQSCIWDKNGDLKEAYAKINGACLNKDQGPEPTSATVPTAETEPEPTSITDPTAETEPEPEPSGSPEE